MPNTPSTPSSWRRTRPRRRSECLDSIGKGVEVDFHKVAHRSASGGPAGSRRRARSRSAGAGFGGGRQAGTGRHRLDGGSAAALLSHSARHQPARLPRVEVRRAVRLTCAYPGTAECVHVVERVGALAERLDVPMRVVTFAVRGRTMYPPEVGLRVEDSILEATGEAGTRRVGGIEEQGVVGEDVTLQVATGNGWDEAIDNADWLDGELLALGTKQSGASPGCSLAPADQRSCGTARYRSWYCRLASTSWCRGRR